MGKKITLAIMAGIVNCLLCNICCSGMGEDRSDEFTCSATPVPYFGVEYNTREIHSQPGWRGVQISSIDDLLEEAEYDSQFPLYDTCYFGEVEKVMALLKQPGINVNARKIQMGQATCETALYAALTGAAKGADLLAIVSSLLEHRADPDIANESGHTALHTVIKSRLDTDGKLTSKLLEYHANLNAYGSQSLTPIVLAKNMGQEVIFKILLDKAIPSRLFLAGSARSLPLMPEIFQVLTETKSSYEIERVDIEGLWEGETVLSFAIKRKMSNKVLSLLISKGAKVNVADQSGDTPLIHACRVEAGDFTYRMIMLLWENGANPNISNKIGETPLLIAINRLDMNLSMLLLSPKQYSGLYTQQNCLLYTKANPYIRDKLGRSLLDIYRVKFGCNPEIMALLSKNNE